MQSTRRGFIQQSAAMVAATSAPWLTNLAAISNADAATTGDYKALVCLFMFGGNDHANAVVPFDDASYATYKAQRPNLYHQANTLLMGDQSASMPGFFRPTGAPALRTLAEQQMTFDAQRKFALSPPLTELYDLYTSSKLAVLLNVGTLLEPTVAVRDANGGLSYRSPANVNTPVNTPLRLGSHNDQVLTWQASSPEGAQIGWGGKIGDQQAALNKINTFTAVSVAGNTVFLTGGSTVPYQVTTDARMSVSLQALRAPVYGSAAVSNALGQIITGNGVVTSTSHIFEQDLTGIIKRSLSADDVLRGIPRQEGDTAYAELNSLVNDNFLAARLRTVAHLIRNNATTGAQRQVFFVGIDGFDNHSSQIQSHPVLLSQISQAMSAFQHAMDGIGLGDKVTTFTASDFGRTFNSNNDGTDHGWGSHHFIMGGAVNGGKLYGTPPIYGDLVTTTTRVPGVTTFEDTGRGSLVPTTSVDQYAATLARWMGVTEANLPLIVPNISKYNLPNWKSNLGFMKA